MTQFDDRERAFEAKFARDEEMQFRIIARRNRLLGEWAAKLMGLSEVEAEGYAKDVVRADFEEAGDEDVIRLIEHFEVLVHEGLGAAVGVGLPHCPDLAVRVATSCSFDGGADFGRVVGVVVDDGNAVYFPFEFKAAGGSSEGFDGAGSFQYRYLDVQGG